MLAYTAVLAPILLVGADIIGRIVVRPAELSVGIVTAIIGAPVFVALVRRRRVAHSCDRARLEAVEDPGWTSP